MATYIVSYQPDEFYAFCTNLATAECEEDVRAEYEGVRCLSIREAKDHEIEPLKQRGCPVVECRPQDKAAKAKRMLDRLVGRIEELELDCDAEVYDALLKIQFALA